MNETHIDVVRDKISLIPNTTTTAHARADNTRKFDYDGKRYGVWIGELRMRALLLTERGHEILAWILLEEAPHFSPDGIISKSHPQNKEEAFEKIDDYLQSVEHGKIFGGIMSVLINIVKGGEEKL